MSMLGGLNQGGGDGQKLARHGVSALLNLAALGDSYPLPPGISGTAGLSNAIRDAYLGSTFEPLATQLAANNELPCPLN